jgi:hypothetical protein
VFSGWCAGGAGDKIPFEIPIRSDAEEVTDKDSIILADIRQELTRNQGVTFW